MIKRLMDQSNLPLIEKMVKFTQARERVLAENIVNLSTPNYTPKDLDLKKFQGLLREQVDNRKVGRPGPSAADKALEAVDADDNILFHDRNNRSVEKLMSDHANNALMHNLMIELMRKQFSSFQTALKERVS